MLRFSDDVLSRSSILEFGLVFFYSLLMGNLGADRSMMSSYVLILWVPVLVAIRTSCSIDMDFIPWLSLLVSPYSTL